MCRGTAWPEPGRGRHAWGTASEVGARSFLLSFERGGTWSPGRGLGWAREPPVTSLYRRHRPQSFDEVVGQAPIVRTMSNAVEQGKVHHAYLFVGSRGTGKTSVAKILARSLNCVKGPTLKPCGECESCRAIAGSTSMDVIEM